MADFDLAYSFTKRWEGGHVHHPDDPGGETWAGISRKYHPDWPGWAHIDQVKDVYGSSVWEGEMWSRTDALVKDFYRGTFWGDLGNLRDQTLATVLFDTAVNCGNLRTGKWLQECLCAWDRPVTIDGIVGPQTMRTLTDLEANRPQEVKDFTTALMDLRGAHYIKQQNPTFTRGWFRRLTALRGR